LTRAHEEPAHVRCAAAPRLFAGATGCIDFGMSLQASMRAALRGRATTSSEVASMGSVSRMMVPPVGWPPDLPSKHKGWARPTLFYTGSADAPIRSRTPIPWFRARSLEAFQGVRQARRYPRPVDASCRVRRPRAMSDSHQGRRGINLRMMEPFGVEGIVSEQPAESRLSDLDSSSHCV
jgi:hypothetical protein